MYVSSLNLGCHVSSLIATSSGPWDNTRFLKALLGSDPQYGRKTHLWAIAPL